MCIDRGRGILKAKEKITVYKVLNGDQLIFRDINGNESNRSKLWEIDSSKDYRLMILNSAIDFDIGYGYSVFLTIEIAEIYLKNIQSELFYRQGNLMMLNIKKFEIPIGTKFEKGLIQYGLIGSFLPAIRTEKLILPEIEVK